MAAVPVSVRAAAVAAEDAPPAPLAPELPPPPAEPRLMLWPDSAFDSVSWACASAACFVCNVVINALVSSEASVPPAWTACPSATLTDATVPLTGNATVACETGSIVATPFWRASTIAGPATAVV